MTSNNDEAEEHSAHVRTHINPSHLATNGIIHQAWCDCGWRGEETIIYGEALADAVAHATVQAPEGQGGRDVPG